MEPPHRITLLMPALQAGGTDRVVATLANEWVAQGRHVRLVTLADPSTSSFFPLDPKVELVRLGQLGFARNLLEGLTNNARRVFALWRAVRLGAPDIIISFIDQLNVLALIVTVGLQVPVIVSERNDPYGVPTKPIWRVLRWVFYRRAAAVVVQTERAGSYFGEGIRERIHVIPNPAPVPELDPLSALPSPMDGTKIAMAMGRLVHQKGFDLLFHAFARIADRHPDWSLEIWGQGELRDELETLAGSLGLSERVRLCGATHQPLREMQRAGLFVLSSRFEGFPNVLCEAMAVGCPVISFDCRSGPSDMIRPGVDGILVPPEDVEALAAGMSDLMADEDKRRRLGERARQIVERFSLERILGEWDQVMTDARGTGRR